MMTMIHGMNEGGSCRNDKTAHTTRGENEVRMTTHVALWKVIDISH